MATDKDMPVTVVMIVMEMGVMITMEVTDTEIMTTPIMETMVNTTISTIIHKRVIIISKTNNSKNFFNLIFFTF